MRKERYNINLDVKFAPLQLIDVEALCTLPSPSP